MANTSGRRPGTPYRNHFEEKPQPKKSRSWIGILVVGVVLVGLIVALVMSLPSSPVKPAPTSPSSTSPSAPTIPDRHSFFDQKTSSEAEEEIRTTLAQYQLSLVLYLNSQGILMENYSDPFGGNWYSAENEWISVSEEMGIFFWYSPADRENDYSYGADYIWWPGCQLNSGFSLVDLTGSPCFSIMVLYTTTVLYGVPSQDPYYGAFLASAPNDQVLILVDQRTGTTHTLEREN